MSNLVAGTVLVTRATVVSEEKRWDLSEDFGFLLQECWVLAFQLNPLPSGIDEKLASFIGEFSD